MGSELVTAPQRTYSQVFEEQFPFYLSIGMTPHQYWEEDCHLVKYYRKAFELQETRKNQNAWLQGLYIYEALCDVSPLNHAFAKQGTVPLPYTASPYPITKNEVAEKKLEAQKLNRDKAKAVFSAWASRVNLNKEKGG